jgi:hypothetical protein
MKTAEYGKQNRDVIMLLHGGGLSWWNYRAEAELLGDPAMSCCRSLTAMRTATMICQYRGKREPDHLPDRQRVRRAVLAIGGLSPRRSDLDGDAVAARDHLRYAVIESASVIPSGITNALIGRPLRQATA